jgi:DNA-binding transcriptional regulator YdaS (Cro superfamily)
MDLKEYLQKEGISVPKFARRLGLHYNTIYLWMKGERDPTRDNALAVQDATSGEVTIDDMLKDTNERQLCPTCNRKLPKNYKQLNDEKK